MCQIRSGTWLVGGGESSIHLGAKPLETIETGTIVNKVIVLLGTYNLSIAGFKLFSGLGVNDIIWKIASI